MPAPKPPHEAIILSIREKHSRIKGQMDEMTSEAFAYHSQNERWPKPAVPKLMGLAEAFGKVESAGLPAAITNHLRHPAVERILTDAMDRDRMEERMQGLLSSIDKDAGAGRTALGELMREFKRAEENVHSGHEAGIYQAGFDRAAEAMEALAILRLDKKALQPSRELDEAWGALFNIREYCRSAAYRHAVWLMGRVELKGLLMDLAKHPDVRAGKGISPSLRAIPPPLEVAEHTITANPAKNRRAAEELVRLALQNQRAT